MNRPIIDEIPSDDSELFALLTAENLPTDDLGEAGRRFFRFRAGTVLTGFIGWEQTDETNLLLRSLVVPPTHRNHGAGRTMLNWALTRTSELGFRDAYALTTPAQDFLIRHGFRRIERNQAPPTVRQSRQFSMLCPVTAALLQRTLP